MSNASHTSANAARTSSPPGADAVKGPWMQKLGAAKLTGGPLTDDAQLQLTRHAEKWTAPVQERCALARAAAARQVTAFYLKHFT